MPVVRLSTGLPVRVFCSEELARRLGMTELTAWGPGEGQGLAIMVTCKRPFPLLSQAYLWPAQPSLGNCQE